MDDKIIYTVQSNTEKANKLLVLLMENIKFANIKNKHFRKVTKHTR